MNLKDTIQEIKKHKKIAIAIILVLCFSVYYWGIRPAQIRKQCAVTTKYDSYQYTNPDYNENVEKKKQIDLGEYIQCRNNNIVEGDQLIAPVGNPYPFTQAQYDTLPLEQFDKLVLGKLAPGFYQVYIYNNIAYVIDNPTYDDLGNNKSNYPQCNFPDKFIQKELWGGSGTYKVDATDQEYKVCLRKNGLNN